ncbi:Glutamate--tRNA ligase 2 [Alphaproteobacteria bacterium]
MGIVTRFAPSPTGLLHVGNIRTAIVNWLYARKSNGKFILRIDDTDKERSEKRYEEAIIGNLHWLGLSWDQMFRQSERVQYYLEAKDKLITGGRLYPCYETVEELELKKKSQLSRSLPPIYDRAALKLTQQQKSELEAKGMKPHWRFLVNRDEKIEWVDRIKGPVSFLAANLNDPVLVKPDGSVTYTLASIVDDIDYGITDIVRGEDHLSNSAVHVQIFDALGAKILPSFAHLSLLHNKEQEISKRIGGFDIVSLKRFGIEAMAINSFLAALGTSDPVSYCITLEELIENFDFCKFNSAGVGYDIDELVRLNTKLISHLPYGIVKRKLQEEGILEVTEEFWELVKSNVSTISSIKEWWAVCKKVIEPKIIDLEFTKRASQLLPADKWDNSIWDRWIEILKKETGHSGKQLFLPIRLALTGLENGPELKVLLPFMGYERVYARLHGVKA